MKMLTTLINWTLAAVLHGGAVLNDPIAIAQELGIPRWRRRDQELDVGTISLKCGARPFTFLISRYKWQQRRSRG